MSYRHIEFSESEYYHVFNRGNSKQIIFKDKADYARFQLLLFLCNDCNPVSVRDAQQLRNGPYGVERRDPLVAIGAYCIMPNHFHMLLTPLSEHGISIFMQKVSTGYAMYFNKRYQRTGGLYEGRFKSVHVGFDQQLKYLFSYIHLNPVRKKKLPKKTPRSDLGENPEEKLQTSLLQRAQRYPYSSLMDYSNGERDESTIVNTEVFPEYFTTIQSHQVELLEWIKFDTEIASANR